MLGRRGENDKNTGEEEIRKMEGKKLKVRAGTWRGRKGR